MSKRNAIDSFLRFGSGFDWITPTFSIIGRWRGKVEGCKVPEDWIPFVQRTLRQAKISIHNDFIIDGYYVFDVSAENIDETCRLLGLVDE